jgi:MFS transporter, MHS family, shikimate and dehydroshikimate transport protein
MRTANEIQNPSVRKVAFASLIGTSIEWYDFFLFNLATISVFKTVFFPQVDMANSLLYTSYLTGFIARPVGAVVCSHYGDRVGRKSMLVFTLLIIGISTFLIGCLPGYSVIGMWAPAALIMFRLAQGFAIGGEWGGAVLMAFEFSSKEKRGFFGSWPQIGVPLGLMMATIVSLILFRLPEAELIGQGWWRVGFLISIILVGIGLYIRLQITETPVFKEIIERKMRAAAPVAEVWKTAWKKILLVTGVKLVENSAFYLFALYIVAFNEKRKFYAQYDVLIAIVIASAVAIFTIPLAGKLSDVYGRKKVYLIGSIFTGLFVYPLFLIFEGFHPFLMPIAMVVALGFGYALMYAPQASFISEMFEPRLRYSGASLGYHLAGALGGGAFTIGAIRMLKENDLVWPTIVILMGMSVISVISLHFAGENIRPPVSAPPAGKDDHVPSGLTAFPA